MMDKSLCVVITGVPAGVLALDDCGALSFRYRDGFRGTPLSLSMPVSNRVYPQKIVLPYLQGLLPDSEDVRRSIAKRYDVGPNNVFALLSHIGLDLPGGVQFCASQQLDGVLRRSGSYEPVTNREIGARLRNLDVPEDSWVGTSEHWSLGGNQGKFALAWHDGTWCSCKGSAPTTHIFKNGIAGYRLQALNEFFCMRLARECGIPAAEVRYEAFDGTPAIIVSRYDRLTSDDGTVIRLHQEDLCQALSVPPSQKYTSDGGPDANAILGLLATTSQAEENMRLFTVMLFFNCLIGATDAHAKNYSILLQGDGHALLAPLYDVASALPYESLRRGGRLAMGIGGENRLGRMSENALGRYARNGHLDRVGLDADWCISLMRGLAERITAEAVALFDDLSDIDGMAELRSHLEDPLLENCRSVVMGL